MAIKKLLKRNIKGEVIGEVTPEEQKQQEQEGMNWLAERERIASQLMESGTTPRIAQKEAMNQLSGLSATQQQQKNIQSNIQLTPEEFEKRKTEMLGELKDQKVFEERPTEEKQLIEGDIFSKEGFAQINKEAEKGTAITNLIRSRLKKRISPELEAAGGMALTGARVQNEIAEFFLDTADRVIILGRGTTELAGSYIQIGDVVNGLFGGRKEVIKNLKTSISDKGTIAGNAAKAVKDGHLSVEIAFKTLNLAENRLNEAEQMIKEEAILSPAIRRSQYLVDIQSNILIQRQEIWDARQQLAEIRMGTSTLEAAGLMQEQTQSI